MPIDTGMYRDLGLRPPELTNVWDSYKPFTAKEIMNLQHQQSQQRLDNMLLDDEVYRQREEVARRNAILKSAAEGGMQDRMQSEVQNAMRGQPPPINQLTPPQPTSGLPGSSPLPGAFNPQTMSPNQTAPPDQGPPFPQQAFDSIPKRMPQGPPMDRGQAADQFGAFTGKEQFTQQKTAEALQWWAPLWDEARQSGNQEHIDRVLRMGMKDPFLSQKVVSFIGDPDGPEGQRYVATGRDSGHSTSKYGKPQLEALAAKADSEGNKFLADSIRRSPEGGFYKVEFKAGRLVSFEPAKDPYAAQIPASQKMYYWEAEDRKKKTGDTSPVTAEDVRNVELDYSWAKNKTPEQLMDTALHGRDNQEKQRARDVIDGMDKRTEIVTNAKRPPMIWPGAFTTWSGEQKKIAFDEDIERDKKPKFAFGDRVSYTNYNQERNEYMQNGKVYDGGTFPRAAVTTGPTQIPWSQLEPKSIPAGVNKKDYDAQQRAKNPDPITVPSAPPRTKPKDIETKVTPRAIAAQPVAVPGGRTAAEIPEPKISVREAGARAAEFGAGKKAMDAQEKGYTFAEGFIRNLDKQANRIQQLLGQDEVKQLDSALWRFGIRFVDVPLNQIKWYLKGDVNEAKLNMYVTEVSTEIAKIASGSQQSIREVSPAMAQRWNDIHDRNLSIKEISEIIKESQQSAHMRLNSLDEALQRSGSKLRKGGIGARIGPQDKYFDTLPDPGKYPNKTIEGDDKVRRKSTKQPDGTYKWVTQGAGGK